MLSKCTIAALALILMSSASAQSAAMSVKEQQEVLSLHNKFRAIHQAPAMVWDERLAEYAENYASKCHFQHSHSPYGENLAAGYPTLAKGVNVWYGEGEKYSYLLPGFSMSTGHFTQMIWKSSTKLGCGYASCDGENGTPGKYLVCEYSPAGNVSSRAYFNRNVLRPRS